MSYVGFGEERLVLLEGIVLDGQLASLLWLVRAGAANINPGSQNHTSNRGKEGGGGGFR